MDYDALYHLQREYGDGSDLPSKTHHNPEGLRLPDERAWVVVAAANGSDYEAAMMSAEAAFPLLGPRLVPLIQCLFETPFYPVWFDPEWRTSTAVALARHLYESRDFSLMPNLADDLQDAGCESPEILAHCRGPGPHVRGCWVVDGVLGES